MDLRASTTNSLDEPSLTKHMINEKLNLRVRQASLLGDKSSPRERFITLLLLVRPVGLS